MAEQPPTAIVDTDVYSLVYMHRTSNDPRIGRWRKSLEGCRVIISFQTRAEVLAGARSRGWSSRRFSRLIEMLDRTPTIRSTDDVVDAYASLYTECRRIGHALHDKQHTADRWIAACAVAKGIDLLAGDGVYRRAPGLSLLDISSEPD